MSSPLAYSTFSSIVIISNHISISSLKLSFPIIVRYFILRCMAREEENFSSSLFSGVPERVVVAVIFNGVVLDFDW